MSNIVRETSKDDLTVTADTVAGIANATAIDMRAFAGGKIITPAGATAQVYSIYGCATSDGTYTPSKDKDGLALELNGGTNVAASEGYELPVAVFAEYWIKLVAASSQQTGIILLRKT